MTKKLKTSQEIEQAFRTELQALLNKYDAELDAKDHYQGYPGCGEDVRMTVSIPSVWDGDGNLVRDWVEIDLGSYMFPTNSEEET